VAGGLVAVAVVDGTWWRWRLWPATMHFEVDLAGTSLDMAL
jgi:hypothetical protein